MASLVRPYTVQEPEVPAGGGGPVLDLDARLKKRPDADALTDIQRAAEEFGVQRFRYQGQDFDRAGAEAALKVARDIEGLGLPTVAPGQPLLEGVSPEESDEAVAAQARTALERRAMASWLREARPMESMTPAARAAFSGYLRASVGMGDVPAAREGLFALEGEDREAASKALDAWRGFRSERAPGSSPEVGFAFAEHSAEQRARDLLSYALKDDPVSKEVQTFFAPLIGDEGRGLIAMTKETQKRVEAARLLTDVGLGDTEALESAYAALKEGTTAVGMLAEPRAFQGREALWVLRQQVEAAAKETGIPYQELRGEPVDWARWDEAMRDQSGLLRRDTFKPSERRPTTDYARKSTRALIGRVLRRKYGEDAADLIVQAEQANARAFDALVEVFNDFDPSQVEGFGDTMGAGEQSYGDFLALAGAWTGGEITNSEEGRGRVRVAEWLLGLVSTPSRWTGEAMRDGGLWWGLGANWGAPKAHLYRFPDGTVFMDPVQAMKHADTVRRQTPEAKWRPEVVYADELTLYPKQAYEPEYDEEGRMLGAALKDTEEYGRIMADSYIFDVVKDRLHTFVEPDNKTGRTALSAVALATDLAADPLNAASGGLGLASNTLRKSSSFARALHKAGLITPEMERLGIKTFDRIAKEIDLGLRKGGKSLTHRTKVALSDGTVLNRNAASRYLVLEKAVGAQAADAVMLEAKAGRSVFRNAIDALADNENFLREWSAHLSRSGVPVGIDDAHDLFTNLYGAMDKVVFGKSWDSSYLYGRARALAYGDPAAAMTRARGLYMAGLPLSPLVTDALGAAGNRFGRLMETAGEGISRYVPATSPAFAAGRKLAQAASQASLATRSLWNVNIVRMRDDLGNHLGFRRLSPQEARAVNLARQTRAAAETTIRRAQAEWALRDDVDALGRPMEAPAWAYEDVGHMWEAGLVNGAESFEEAVRYAAGVRKIRGDRKNLARLNVDNADDYDAIKRELLESVTDAEYTKLLREWEPYRGIYERGIAVNQRVGEAYKSAGLADPIPYYAPHHFRFSEDALKKRSLLRVDSNGDVVMRTPQMRKDRLSLSGHVLEREGPLTLLDGEIQGLNPIRDMRTAMELRLQRFVDDMAEAQMVQELGRMGSLPYPDGLRAMRALMAREMPQTSEVDRVFRQRVRDATARSASFDGRRKELTEMLTKEREAERKLVRLQAAAKEPAEIEVAQFALDKIREGRLAAVGKFAEEFDLAVAEVAAWTEHTQFGRDVARNRSGNLGRKIDAARRAGDEAEVARLAEQRAQAGEDLAVYRRAADAMNDMGIDPARQGALTWELYRKPTVHDLTLDEARNLVERHASAMAAIDNRPAVLGRFHETPEEARRLWMAQGRPEGQHFTKWLEEDETALAKRLRHTYLPIETLMSLRSMGYRLGKRDLIKETGFFAGVNKIMDGVAYTLLPANRFWKGMVTVWNPSLHFGRRNQIDAYSKMWQYSGLHAAVGSLRTEYEAWRAGKLDFFHDGLGNRVNAKEAWEQASPLFQSFERRLDIYNPATLAARADDPSTLHLFGRKNTDEAIAKRVGKATAKGAAAARPGILPRVGAHSTQGSPARAIEQIAPFGKGVSEAFDNQVRSWTYFVSRKAGMSHEASLEEAFRVGRDYSNLTRAEARLFGVLPVMFYNFFKQNLRSIPAVLDRGGVARVVMTEKFRRYMEAELPEDLRPMWMNAMDSIMSPTGALYLPRDLGGVSVLDSAATLANGFLTQFKDYRKLTGQRQLPPSMYLKESGQAFADMASPVVQMVTRGGEYRDIRVPRHVAEAMADHYLEGGKGEYKNPMFRVVRRGGEAVVEATGLGNFVLGLSGTGVLATTLFRHSDAFREGGWAAALNASGMFKKYPYGVRGLNKLRGMEESLLEYGDAVYGLSQDGGGSGLWLDHDIPGADGEAYEFLNQFWEYFGGGTEGRADSGGHRKVGFLRDLMADLNAQIQSIGLEPMPSRGPGVEEAIRKTVTIEQQ